MNLKQAVRKNIIHIYINNDLRQREMHTVELLEPELVLSRLSYNSDPLTVSFILCIKTTLEVAKFKYLGTTLTDQNYIRDEIKSRLNSGNACYYSVQNLLSSRLI
jgi:hypothetical protein